MSDTFHKFMTEVNHKSAKTNGHFGQLRSAESDAAVTPLEP